MSKTLAIRIHPCANQDRPDDAARAGKSKSSSLGDDAPGDKRILMVSTAHYHDQTPHPHKFREFN
jgi:hypothetical protein